MMLRQLILLKNTKIAGITLFPKLQFSRKKLNTQVFADLSWGELATPQLTKKLIISPIHMHSRVSQRGLYHGKRVRHHVKSCFSEKKTKVYRRVNKLKQYFYSDILKQKIFVNLSMKAYKIIMKMGSFDNYILCTKPKDLDSKYGEYLRELMLRKINDENFRLPYIIGTNRKLKIKSYRKYKYDKQRLKHIVPKQFKDNFRTYQRRFGARPEELNEQDYKKYSQLQELKRKLGKQLDPAHPLILQLRAKMYAGPPEEELKKLDELASEAQKEYLAKPQHLEYKKKKIEKAKKEFELLQNKIRQLSIDTSQFDV